MFLKLRDIEGSSGELSLNYIKNNNNTVKVQGTYTVEGSPTTFESNTLATPTSKDDLFLWLRKDGYSFDTRLAKLNEYIDRSYTVTFNSLGRTISVNSLTTNEYYKLNYVPIPNDEKFLGWYDEEMNLITKDTVFTKNTVVKAKYNIEGLCFTSETSTASVTLTSQSAGVQPYSITLQYTTDGETWNNYTIGNVITLNGKGSSVWFRGNNSGGFSKKEGTDWGYYKFNMTGKISCSNNILYLISTSATAPSTLPLFFKLFYGCTSLTTAPDFPNITLTNYCYYDMFHGCTSLTTPPVLPSTVLAEGCYEFMFKDCSNLLNTPNLPATTLAAYCYCAMFEGCTSLTSTGEFKATTLATECYLRMFSGCSSLSNISPLPATTLAYGCYSYMFVDCTNLVTTPELPATTLASNCYSGMFKNCTSLTIPSSLPATTLPELCYESMFEGCTSIKLSTTPESSQSMSYRIPTSGTGVDSTGLALDSMFVGTGGSFKGTPSINTTYWVNL